VRAWLCPEEYYCRWLQPTAQKDRKDPALAEHLPITIKKPGSKGTGSFFIYDRAVNSACMVRSGEIQVFEH